METKTLRSLFGNGGNGNVEPPEIGEKWGRERPARPASPDDERIIVALDIGTTKMVALVGQLKSDGDLNVIGLGSSPSRGLKKGVVVDIDSTVHSIQRAIEEAELMAGCPRISSVFVGISGSHIQGINSHGIVAVKDSIVTDLDVDRVLDAAQAVPIPADQRFLHILPQEFLIDSQDGIRDPVRMSGVRLEAKVHLVTCAVNLARNIERCVNRCQLAVEGDLILEQLASSYAVLQEDEKELGVCLVDIGGGTSDIAVFTQGAIRHTAVIPIAGDQVTNDIAMALRTPTDDANAIKEKYACAQTQLVGPEQVIKVPSVGNRPARELSRQALAEVVEPRYDELFSLIQAELRRSGFEELVAAGIVLTGGASKIEGGVGLAEDIFNMPVRLGVPTGVTGLAELVENPVYATAVGLLLHGQREVEAALVDQGPGPGWQKRMADWIRGNF